MGVTLTLIGGALMHTNDDRRICKASAAITLSLLLAACGGGGGVGSTPNPPPTLTPTPAPPPAPPTSQELGVTSGATGFDTFSTRTTQKFPPAENTITNSLADRAELTFSYDAGKGVYSVSGGGVTSTFGNAERLGYDDVGDLRFSREIDEGKESLTLLGPQRLGGGTQNVSIGLWQRRTNVSDFRFDIFAYGFPTRKADVPLSGRATYDIDLFGVASPIGSFPRSVVGEGTFSLDFAQGLFAMSGEAGEYNNDADYSTCCNSWQGAGYLASTTRGLTGYFTYNGREGHIFQASVLGGLYGPKGTEVGGSIVGRDGSDATFTGAFAGTREREGIDVSLSALDQGYRSYYSFQGTSAASQRVGARSSDSGAYYFPAAFGTVEFGADGSVTPMFGINDTRFDNVTFQATDRVEAQSDDRFDVYDVRNSNGEYRLEMFKPGVNNSKIELTYSSFGHWREDRAIGDAARHSLSTWFSYGVRTVNGTLPPAGSAHFNATVLGSGERFDDMAQLTLKGTSSITIDFAAARIDGTFNAHAWTAANEMITLPAMTFGTKGNAYSFETLLYHTPDRSNGSISGSLYGPGGEEIGGAFDFSTRITEGGMVDAVYSGVFFGKRD